MSFRVFTSLGLFCSAIIGLAELFTSQSFTRMATIFLYDGGRFIISSVMYLIRVRNCNLVCTGFWEFEDAARFCSGPHLSHLSDDGDLQAPVQETT